MLERPPFEICPSCKSPNSFGILSAGGSTLNRRCTKCRYSHAEILPSLNKAVVYLDQLAISEIFKVKSGARRAEAGGQAFWEEVTAQTNRSYLFQQVIFPSSNIHRDETIVSPFGSDLALAHEMLSGDVSLIDVADVELAQTIVFAEAYLNRRQAPQLEFGADEILEGERNDWLPDLHITAGFDYGVFAERLRLHREEAALECEPLWRQWVADTDILGRSQSRA